MKKVIKSLFISAALATAATAGEPENFGGLGISVWTGKTGVKIAGVIPNSPAESIGLQTGDLIVSANGTEFSAVEPQNQVSYLRGEAGTSINLVVNRDGDVFSVSAKRMGFSLQNLEAQEISEWYGKEQGITAEEVNFLASQKITEGYQFLAAMQYGMPISNSVESININAIQQISIQKAEEAKLPEEKPIQNNLPDMSMSGIKDHSLVNAKGAMVKKQGNVPVYKILK
jgi:membrane-associated protease RseP (regulator of RpoE activity)